MLIKSKTCLVYSPGGHSSELQKSLVGIYFKKKYHVTFFTGTARKSKDRLFENFNLI